MGVEGRAKKQQPFGKGSPTKSPVSRWRRDGGSGRYCWRGGVGVQGGRQRGHADRLGVRGGAGHWDGGWLSGRAGWRVGGVGGEWGLASQRTRSRPAAGIHSEARVGCPTLRCHGNGTRWGMSVGELINQGQKTASTSKTKPGGTNENIKWK